MTSIDSLLQYYIYQIIESLKSYITKKGSGLQKPLRKQFANNMYRIVRIIRVKKSTFEQCSFSECIGVTIHAH